MKQRFWLFKRGSVFYLQDSETGKKISLGTRDLKQAERLRAAKNEAAEKPLLGLTLGKAYLSAYDPKLVERKWGQVMDEFCQRGRDSSKARYARALKSPALSSLRDKKIVDTTVDELRALLADNHSLIVVLDLNGDEAFGLERSNVGGDAPGMDAEEITEVFVGRETAALVVERLDFDEENFLHQRKLI